MANKTGKNPIQTIAQRAAHARAAVKASGPQGRHCLQPADRCVSDAGQKASLMNTNSQQHHAILQGIAHRAMIERGLLPDFSTQVLAELEGIQASATAMNGESVRDLTDRLWHHDNDDSRDLDQLTVARPLPGDQVKLWVAIAGCGCARQERLSR